MVIDKQLCLTHKRHEKKKNFLKYMLLKLIQRKLTLRWYNGETIHPSGFRSMQVFKFLKKKILKKFSNEFK